MSLNPRPPWDFFPEIGMKRSSLRESAGLAVSRSVAAVQAVPNINGFERAVGCGDNSCHLAAEAGAGANCLAGNKSPVQRHRAGLHHGHSPHHDAARLAFCNPRPHAVSQAGCVPGAKSSRPANATGGEAVGPNDGSASSSDQGRAAGMPGNPPRIHAEAT